MFSGICCPTLKVFVLLHKALQREIIEYIYVLVICALRYVSVALFSGDQHFQEKWQGETKCNFGSPESNFHDSIYSLNGPVCLYYIVGSKFDESATELVLLKYLLCAL